MNGPPANDRTINDITIARAPAATPPMNEVVIEMLPGFSITSIA
ncbi:MAG TPA: hypothetical protein VFI73_02380 [Candidatus Nitrosopolaris sp.]|nr:hypothetical protein [Candidatus Nitrosopolaris sp.]